MKWDSQLYENSHKFVSDYGEDLLEFIPNDKSLNILDVGCGTGALTQKLSTKCRYVLGTDNSTEMIVRAKVQYPDIDFKLLNVLSMDYKNEWDIVFSNAVFHWVMDHDLLLKNIANALKPSGKLVCEFGAFGNIQSIEKGFSDVLNDFGYAYTSKFSFPKVDEFTGKLKENHFIIEEIYDYDRPTPLLGGEKGLTNWAKQFFASDLDIIPEQIHHDIFVALEDKVRSALWDNASQKWIADYRRIRVVAYVKKD